MTPHPARSPKPDQRQHHHKDKKCQDGRLQDGRPQQRARAAYAADTASFRAVAHVRATAPASHADHAPDANRFCLQPPVTLPCPGQERPRQRVVWQRLGNLILGDSGHRGGLNLLARAPRPDNAGTRRDPRGYRAASHCSQNRAEQDAAALRLLSCMPTSLHGCAALLNYVLETSDEDFPDTADGVTFIRAVVRNVTSPSQAHGD